jgi:hypothetical protein
LHLDAPLNASFVNPATRLRVDLLFDFPVAAALIARRAVRRTIRSVVLHVASDEDLLQLKRIATPTAPSPATPRTSRSWKLASGAPDASGDARSRRRAEDSLYCPRRRPACADD